MHVCRAAIIACAVIAFTASGVSAQARVLVEVRNPDGGKVNGQVTLSATGDTNKKFTCRTSGGRCTISGVPGGRYVVVFRPNKGKAGSPQQAMIPPDGEVKLRVSSR